MKRKIVLLPLLLMALFVSCTKVQNNPKAPQNEPKVPEKAFNIVGTKWEATYRFDEKDPKSALVSVIYDFKTSTEVVFVHTIKEGSVDPGEFPNEPINLSYTYITPTLKILSADKKTRTVYKVDEKAGTMSIVGDEVLDNGKWVEGKEGYKITLQLKK